jgi:hypothetical protein
VLDGIKEWGRPRLSTQDAWISQLDSAKWAASNGYARFAVTVADADTAKRLRNLETEIGVRILMIGAHLTGISPEDAKRLLAMADIVTSCASLHIREQTKSLIQMGTAVPDSALPNGAKIFW